MSLDFDKFAPNESAQMMIRSNVWLAALAEGC